LFARAARVREVHVHTFDIHKFDSSVPVDDVNIHAKVGSRIALLTDPLPPRWFVHMRTIANAPFHLGAAGLLIDDDGSVSPVVHQFDRFPELVEFAQRVSDSPAMLQAVGATT